MARKRSRGINVSKAIRDYVKDNPNAGPTEAAAAISEQLGKKVSPTYVSNVKSLTKETGKKRGRRGRKAGAARATRMTHGNGSVQLATIEAMKAIVGQIGADTARQLIDLLA